MRFRKLRIAWSVFWGIAAVLLIVLWVRSYYVNDEIYYRSISTLIQITPSEGIVRITDCSVVADMPNHQMKIGWSAHTADHLIYENEFANDSLFARIFRKLERPAPITWLIPHWLFVLTVGTAATIPLWPKRFTLRTLLIATTLVAVVLGLIVYATRQ